MPVPRFPIFACLFSLPLLGLPSTYAQTETGTFCKENKGQVSVTVIKKISAVDEVYEYTITNNVPGDSIESFKLGESNILELKEVNKQPIEIVSSPVGWSGRIRGVFESSYIRIIWNSSNPDSNIMGGETRAGFKVGTKKIEPNNLGYWPNGTRVQPIVLSQIAFKVRYHNSTDCYWGRADMR